VNSSSKILFGLLIFVSLFFMWEHKKQKEMNKKLQKQIAELEKRADSLENEIFTSEIKLFRFERAIEIFEERNPYATSQLSDIISDETE